MAATPLSWDRLSDVPVGVARPRYEPKDVTPGVVHVGVGGRAHQAMYLDDLMNRGHGLDHGIVGVGTQPVDRTMRDALPRQDCLYSLVVKHPGGQRDVRVIGSIVEYLFGDLFGDLARNERFAAEYEWALSSLHTIGARDTVAALVSRLEASEVQDRHAGAARPGQSGSRRAHG